MRYGIHHRTLYRYATPAASTRQLLRLSPRRDPHQRVLRWAVRVPGAVSSLTDAYGNVSQLHALDAEHSAVPIEVEGLIDVDPLKSGALEERHGPPPAAFLAHTPLTEVDASLAAFARRHLRGRRPRDLLDFALAVRAAIAYRPGATTVGTTAAQALDQGQGVCQDHAHVFIAGCRFLGVPARYVSGYYHRPDLDEAATHAWADAWLPEDGWVSIDVTHECFAGEALCRLAVGRDYDSASPVRGVRVGGSGEHMEVSVKIRPLEPATVETANEVTA